MFQGPNKPLKRARAPHNKTYQAPPNSPWAQMVSHDPYWSGVGSSLPGLHIPVIYLPEDPHEVEELLGPAVKAAAEVQCLVRKHPECGAGALHNHDHTIVIAIIMATTEAIIAVNTRKRRSWRKARRKNAE